MSSGSTPRIAGVSPGPPFDFATWSGTSHYLLSALARRGALVGAVDASPSVVTYLEKAASFSPDMRRWRQRYAAGGSALAGVARRARSRVGARRLAALDAEVDAVMQIGGWYDFSGFRLGRPVLRCSYHDGNLATFLRQPGLAFDKSSAVIRRAWKAERALYDRLDLILTMSEWTRQSFVDEFEQDPDKVVMVGAGANLPLPSELPQRDFSRPHLLFVGKGDFIGKGGAQILAAFERVRSRHPEAELSIVGQPTLPTTQPGVRNLGVISRRAAGGEAALDRVYREATMFLMPSIYECFGIAFVEAMALGLPCIGAATCAMPEIIEDGRTGFVVTPGSSDELAQRILELIEDPDRARDLGDAGRQRVLDRFSWDRVAERIVAELSSRLDLDSRPKSDVALDRGRL
jgi:alpha-maltose-1-phosphate synthase